MQKLKKRVEALEQAAGTTDARVVVLYKDTDTVPMLAIVALRAA